MGNANRHASGSRVLSTIEGFRLPRRRLEQLCRSVLRGEKTKGTVQIIVTDAKEMRRLNRRYRGKDRATDVLTFPIADNGLIGEIYCNHEHCLRWSKMHGGTVTDELLRLVAHGCLHLVGYDHHSAADALRMRRAEDRLMSAGGLISARTRNDKRD